MNRSQILTPIAEALERLDDIPPLEKEAISVTDALGRVLAEDVSAACDMPPFAQSAVDGYAVRHADLSAPWLPMSGEVRAGPLLQTPRLAMGAAQRVYTGAMLPEGADTVIRQEWVRVENGRLFVTRTVSRGNDARRAGEELAAGSPLAPRGTRLTAGMVAALAGAGVAVVSAHARPRISVLVTGDEVSLPGARLRLGSVYDANGPLVTNWLSAQGYSDIRLLYASDSPEALDAALGSALAGSDLVITTGGVSVGDHDHVPAVASALGAKRVLWRVAQKPGMPLFVAVAGHVPLLGLPGNPASVLVNLVSFGRRVLDRLEGANPSGPAYKTGILAGPARPPSDRDLWLRVAVNQDAEGRANLAPLPRQGSHMLSNLLHANGLAWVPASTCEIPAGSRVRWIAL